MAEIVALSDLHWEGGGIKPVVVDEHLGYGDILILAGDIVTARAIKSNAPYLDHFMKTAKERFEHVIAVPGNHEPYGMDFFNAMSILEDFYEDYGAWLLQDAYMELDGVKVFGGTLGTNFGGSPEAAIQALMYINDYRLIKFAGGRWSTKDSRDQFDNFIKNLSMYPDLDVVVSHFSPSMRSCHAKWGDTPLNNYFHNSIDNIVKDSKAQLWVHGHTHDPSDYMIGNTRVYCNPRGYHHEGNILKLNEVIRIDN